MRIHLIEDMNKDGILIGKILITFFDNLHIADKCGFITTLNDKAIGFVSWDSRNMPEYAEIRHSYIASKHKGNGYGKIHIQEAVNRITKNDVKKSL